MNTRCAGERLNELLAARGHKPLDDSTARRFEGYLALFLRWNERVNLSGIRDEEGIISRHLIESIEVARDLPGTIQTLLDYGSGGGLPGIPIALCRPEMAVTLAESQSKKAAFLQEAVRALRIRASVYGERAEKLGTDFDCVILRAVDRMPRAVATAARLVRPKAWLALMTTDAELEGLHAAAGSDFNWADTIRLSGSESRVLSLGQRVNSPT